jgi:predicted Zn-dependent protease
MGGLFALGCLGLLTPGGETGAGREAAAEVERSMGLVDDPELIAYVRRIGARPAQRAERRGIEYRFFVVDMPEPNAFALPGGFVYISRGLLALANSEDELANALGHEVGHVEARHHLKGATSRVVFLPVQIAAGLGEAATSIVSPTLGRSLSGVVQLPGALSIAAYSRNQEREADAIGQQLAAEEGWDPAGLSALMTALAREQELAGGEPSRLNWLASHPTSVERSRTAGERARTLERGAAHPIAGTRVAFLQKLDGLMVGPDPAQGAFVGERFLHPVLDFTLSFPEGWETLNQPTFVAAREVDGEAVALLQLADGADPRAAAEKFRRSTGLRFERGPEAVKLDGGQAVRAEARAAEERRVHLTWLAHDERVFQLAGIAPEARFDGLRPTFDALASSFRALRAADLALIRESRLRPVQVRAGEGLAATLERSDSTWSPEKAAIANGIELDAALEAGAWLKVAVPQRYEPPPAGR